MADFEIKKGFDLKLGGKPASDIVDRLDASSAIAYPLEFSSVKQRLQVQEGDHVKRGSVLIEDKKNPDFKIRAPMGGTIKSIIRGERRFVEQVVIQADKEEQTEAFTQYAADSLATADRDAIVSQLVSTGYISYIRQRPYDIPASPADTPKSIFVNAMNTGPHQVDANVVVADDTEAFSAGLTLLSRLTEGAVHVCAGPDATDAIKSAQGAQSHTFTGPHPAGNSSVHIARVDPLRKDELIWTIDAADLVLVGRLFLDGVLPASRVISIGGSGIQDGQAKHYRVRIGADLTELLKEVSSDGTLRVINGDVLSGATQAAEGALRFGQSSVTVIENSEERHFMGWLNPGKNLLSFSRAYVSTFAGGPAGPRNLNTNRNGGKCALVLTGLYDKVMPLNIMVDYLIRAIMAGETGEAIKLGLLEVSPEDFALCDFVWPCKTEIQTIIKDGIQLVMEEEGIA